MTDNEYELEKLDISREQVLLDAWAYYRMQRSFAQVSAQTYRRRLADRAASRRKLSDKTTLAFKQCLLANKLEARNAKYVMDVLEKAIGRKPVVLPGGDAA